LTPSLWVSGLGINLALAPQTPNFYPICVGSSKSLRHLTHSIWVQCPRLVSSETPLQILTPDEPEAFHRGRSRSSHVMKKPRRSPRRQSHVGPFGVFSFFIATWKICPTDDTLNFGQTCAPFFLVANGWAFPKWTPVSLFSMTDATTIS
jgi:hypothetical protein